MEQNQLISEPVAQLLRLLLVRHGYATAENVPKGTGDLLAFAQEVLAEDRPAYALIQEGGSTGEFYLHAHDTPEQAEADRVRCSADGAYATSPVVAVPCSLELHPDFYRVVEEFIQAYNELECVETPD